MPLRLWQRWIHPAERPSEHHAPEVRALLRPIVPVAPDDSLGKVLYRFSQQQLPALPVADGRRLVGWITEQRVSDRLLRQEATIDQCTVMDVMEPPPLAVPLAMPLDALVSLLAIHEESLLPVIGMDGVYLGCLLRADVLAMHTRRLVPPRIGGMATPLGVYLTTGTVSAGIGDLGLILAGAAMAALFWVAQVLLLLASLVLYRVTNVRLFIDLAHALNEETAGGSFLQMHGVFLIAMLLLLGMILLLFRYAPRLAGFHAAEHQTVNAIEAGEPLIPAIVARMPRVHPRCGTNLAGVVMLAYIGVTVLSAMLYMDAPANPRDRLNISGAVPLALVMVLAVTLTWRRLGGWIQAHLTTRPPTPAELASGIRAGRELLDRYQEHLHDRSTPWQRFWKRGIIQVLIGVLPTAFFLQLANVPLDYLFHSLVK
ncbi:MAG: DUF1385 domain-containing protein [Armatimonadota bacterium]